MSLISNIHKAVIGVTTFQRLPYIKQFTETWEKTKSDNFEWTFIAADDGSTDGTLEYLDNLVLDADKIIIKSNELL